MDLSHPGIDTSLLPIEIACSYSEESMMNPKSLMIHLNTLSILKHEHRLLPAKIFLHLEHFMQLPNINKISTSLEVH